METIRIAMWSGPRNISTAMLRSFGNRDDTVVVDEPLYAHYLRVTKKVHPGGDEVVARHESDWRRVVEQLVSPLPAGKRLYYQKHMAHHLLPDIDRDWLDSLTHAFLIREPREMLTSLIKQIPDATLEDTGLPQQLEIFERLLPSGAPPVLDSRDVLEDPRRLLSAFCDRVGIGFDEAMLEWPAGPRDTDGCWAPHWYEAVWKSTSFQPYRPKNESLPDHLAPLLDECQAIYDQLHAHRIRPS